MGVDPQAQDAQVSFIPLDATGNAYGQGFGLYWNEGQRAYRLVVGGQAVPPPNVPDGSTLPRHTPLPSETQAPGEIEIVLYWVVDEELQPEYRRIPATQAVGTAALELLLAGPQQPGLSTALPTPEEVQSYPGRQPDWGDRVRLLGLTIEDGVATANFSQEMRAYGGGSARVHMIRAQITQTLLQFPTVQEVRIAVEGEVDTALQP
jgi:spore germination protein GerM